MPDRAVLSGIVFVARTGTPWRLLPPELGAGSRVTAWRRLRGWQDAGVWERLHATLLDRLGQKGGVGWSRAGLDSSGVRAERGANRRGPTRSTEESSAPSTT